MQRRYVTADGFTDRIFGGNPLAVVLGAAALTAAQMQAIPSKSVKASTQRRPRIFRREDRRGLHLPAVANSAWCA
jgi:hypothetical protein